MQDKPNFEGFHIPNPNW